MAQRRIRLQAWVRTAGAGCGVRGVRALGGASSGYGAAWRRPHREHASVGQLHREQPPELLGPRHVRRHVGVEGRVEVGAVPAAQQLRGAEGRGQEAEWAVGARCGAAAVSCRLCRGVWPEPPRPRTPAHGASAQAAGARPHLPDVPVDLQGGVGRPQALRELAAQALHVCKGEARRRDFTEKPGCLVPGGEGAAVLHEATTRAHAPASRAPSSSGLRRPPGRRKKFWPICSMSTCGWLCSATSSTASTLRRMPCRS